MRTHLLIALAALSVLGCGDDPATDTDASPMMMPDASDASTTPDAEPVDCSGRSAESIETRGEHQGVYDAARGRIVIYGGIRRSTDVPTAVQPRRRAWGCRPIATTAESRPPGPPRVCEHAKG